MSVVPIIDPNDDKPLSMASHYALAAIREELETQGVFHLAALSAGAVSPFRVARQADEPGREFKAPSVELTGVIRTKEQEAEVEALGQDYDLTPALPVVTAAELEALAYRESEFVKHSRNRSGETLTLDAAAKRDEARALVNRQTKDLALALVSEGIPAFMPDTAPKASIVCPMTGARIDPLPVRRVNFLPAVAQQRRSGMITHLEAFLERYPNTQMVTFTRGPRLIVHDADELREALGAFHRRLSNLNKGWLMRRFGFELAFAATELGTVEPLVSGGLSVHIHAHTFGRFTKPLHRAQERCFYCLMLPHWGAVWDFGKTVYKAREACKYPVKPSDLDKLSNEDVALLFHALRGMKMVRPLGELRTTIRDRVAAAIKGRRWKVQKGRETALELQFRPDWNTQPRKKKKVKKRLFHLSALPVYVWKKLIDRANAAIAETLMQRRAALRAIVARRAEVLAGLLQRRPSFEAKRRRIAAKSKIKAKCLQAALWLFFWFTSARTTDAIKAARAKAAASKHLRKPIQNQIVARLAAAAYFDRISRPALLVWNYDGNLAALTSHLFVAEVVAATEAQVKAAENNLANFDAQDKAAKIRAAEIDAEAALSGFRGINNVHTSHTTGLAKNLQNGAQKPARNRAETRV